MIARLLAFLPGGQVVGLGATLLALAGKLLKGIFDGVAVCIANPVVFIILGMTFVAGLYEGTRWNMGKVVAARQEVARMKEDWKRADAEAQAKLEKALADADRAEKAARAAATRAGIGNAQRMRPATPAPASSGPSLSWFPSLPKSN